MKFVVFGVVFLTCPTIEELQNLDMSLLMDMLVSETDSYAKIFTTEGFTEKLIHHREIIQNLQAAIELKRKAEKSSPGSGQNSPSSQHS